MIPKVALHSRGQDLFPEVADFQACGDGLAKEFVVCFDLFVRGFHKDFSVFVAQAHQGLRPSGYAKAPQKPLRFRVVKDKSLIIKGFRPPRNSGRARQQA